MEPPSFPFALSASLFFVLFNQDRTARQEYISYKSASAFSIFHLHFLPGLQLLEQTSSVLLVGALSIAVTLLSTLNEQDVLLPRPDPPLPEGTLHR